uniref:Si:ch211-161f7.2 n=1 Tax=Danio rerio TaxID=7955 RepID=A0A0R4ICM1_DANRE|nr:retinoic acid-induced protein 2-like [Danio rerio]|eukprot:XP_017213831.1 retinoic acid-induced protein 2-like [Danio rerio]
MEDLQTKEVKKYQTKKEETDCNGPDCSNSNDKEQIRKTSPQFNSSNEHSMNLALKLATSFLNCVCHGNKPFVLPVDHKISKDLPAETRPASRTVSDSNTISLVLDQCLNSQLPPTLHSYPFDSYQSNENLLSSQSEALDYNTDISVFQGPNIGTHLQNLVPSLSNYASSDCQMTGQQQSIPLTSNVLPYQSVQPSNTPMTSLIPPATLLVPYPLVFLLPVPLPIPIPIPIQIPQSLYSNTIVKPSRTDSMIDKSTQISSSISCCTDIMFSQTPSVSQDEVLDLSFKTTLTKHEHPLSASPNLPLDLSVVNTNTKHQDHWHDGMSGRCKRTTHESKGNNIIRSKYEDYNGRTVHSAQTVIVSRTEILPFSDKRKGFSRDYMINSATKPDKSQNTVIPDCSRRPFRVHPLSSEPQFKRRGSPNMYGNTPPYKKHLASFQPGK